MLDDKPNSDNETRVHLLQADQLIRHAVHSIYHASVRQGKQPEWMRSELIRLLDRALSNLNEDIGNDGK